MFALGARLVCNFLHLAENFLFRGAQMPHDPVLITVCLP
jgi:hypothetical protein